MSGVTNTLFEELYASAVAATTTTPAAAAASLTAGWPTMEIPAGYFRRLGKDTNTAKLYLRGQMTTTAVIPTWQFGLAWTQAMPGAFSAANVLAATAVRTPGTAQAGAWFFWEMDIGLRALAPGAASQLFAAGSVMCESLRPAAYSATQSDEWTLPATGGTGLSAASIDVDQQIFLWPYVTLGAATAGNTVTMQLGKLYGEN
jgi:hypothetical protein